MENPPTATANGWSWHKNLQLPSLNVSCSAVLPEGAACLMSAVTIDVLTHSACDTGLEGDILKPLLSGGCSFSSLTFKTTSYNLKGKSIHLMASLLLRTGDHLSIASSLLSEPLMVDARKRLPKEKTGGKAADASGNADVELLPFAPGLLERTLQKVDRASNRLEIDNSAEGLRNYLTALNLRNKCKHPLFLVLRFSACVGLWYDTTVIADPLKDDESFHAMMKALGNFRSDTKAVATGASPKLPPFVIALHDNRCHVQLPPSLVLLNGSALPSAYRMLCDEQLNTLRCNYCRLHAAAQLTHCMQATAQLAPPPAETVLRCTVPPAGPALMPREGPDFMPPAGPALMPMTAAPAAASTSALRHAERLHAAKLLAEARVMAGASSAEAQSPEQSWEAELRLIAEALALHCRTRSSEEIVAFAQHGEARASKRLQGHEHSHEHHLLH